MTVHSAIHFRALDNDYSIKISAKQQRDTACPTIPRVAERAADRTAGRQSRTYLARFQSNSSIAPDVDAGLVNFSSSAVREVIIRF